jgi:hypothetical protein
MNGSQTPHRIIVIRGPSADTKPSHVPTSFIQRPVAVRRTVIIKNGVFVGGRPTAGRNETAGSKADAPMASLGLDHRQQHQLQAPGCV